MTKLDELKGKMTEAVKVFTATGNMEAIQAVNAELNKAKADIAKTEGTRLLAEAEALAGKRGELESKVKQAVSALGLDKLLAEVKAKGFTYTIDHKETDKGVIDSAGEVSVKGGVGLLVSSVRTRKAGAGGGAGKSKDEYGMSLSDIVDKFATADEQAAIVGADSNSKSWQLKVAVKKRAIADGKLAPVK